MKIFNAFQLREMDLFTIDHEPVKSIDLMERAAAACCSWICTHYSAGGQITVFCGSGNNGGDGLAIARQLSGKEYQVQVYLIPQGDTLSPDCRQNLDLLPKPVVLHRLSKTGNFPDIRMDMLVIDALLGTGISRPAEGNTAEAIQFINNSRTPVVSIDLPSGMHPDLPMKGPVVQATHTLSFTSYKLSMLLPGIGESAGEIHIIPIGIAPETILQTPTLLQMTDRDMLNSIYRKRKPFSNKGDFGHGLIIAGSAGKMGAAVLATRGCLRAGAGLVTCLVPQEGRDILQVAAPEAMCLIRDDQVADNPDLSKYRALGIGPGLGTSPETDQLLDGILARYGHPMVLDADALNLMALHPGLMEKIPGGSLLTPHPGEFGRLFGHTSDAYSRLDLLRQKSRELGVIILLKGRFTQIALPDGTCFFNSTGNPGMATGGSGDCLTGILTGLLCQGYSPADTAILGTWLHGLAGDIAATRFSQEAMLATDLLENLAGAFKSLEN